MKKLMLALVAVIVTPAIAADDLLTSLAGEWIGRGTYRHDAEAEPERVFCKVANALSVEGNALFQKGRCALASDTAAIEIKITALGSGRYTGSGGGVGLAARGQATITGNGTANHLALVAQLVDTQTQKTATATATIEVSPDGSHRMLARMTDPKTGATYTASEIFFTAK